MKLVAIIIRGALNNYITKCASHCRAVFTRDSVCVGRFTNETQVNPCQVLLGSHHQLLGEEKTTTSINIVG